MARSRSCASISILRRSPARTSRSASAICSRKPRRRRENRRTIAAAVQQQGGAMKPELNLLVWAVALTVVQMLVAAQGAMNQVGFMRLVGNREGMPEITGWGGRAARAHRNMLENLVLFASLVLVAVVAGKTNEMKLL